MRVRQYVIIRCKMMRGNVRECGEGSCKGIHRRGVGHLDIRHASTGERVYISPKTQGGGSLGC